MTKKRRTVITQESHEIWIIRRHAERPDIQDTGPREANCDLISLAIAEQLKRFRYLDESSEQNAAARHFRAENEEQGETA